MQEISRRSLLAATAGMTAAGCATRRPASMAKAGGVLVNDVHAQISETRMRRVVMPRSLDELRRHLASAGEHSVCGGRYSSGGQPFVTGGDLLDLQEFDAVRGVDVERGLITCDAGIRWPKLMRVVNDRMPGWAIRQKQSGADEVSLGGALSVNCHGRCLAAPPICDDVEQLQILEPSGDLLTCSRTQNADRFAHALGGHGLFGMIASVTLRLVPRTMLRRRVQIVSTNAAVRTLDAAAERGGLYGDFQYCVDDTSDGFMREGLAVTYEPCGEVRPTRVAESKADSDAAFLKLAMLAHADKAAAWRAYVTQMQATDRQADWSDAWQAAQYLPGYHAQLEQTLGRQRGSEVLSEVYVPRETLGEFMADMASVLRDRDANLIYGNVRLIEPDTVTALPWATGRMVCIVFNLHLDHTPGDVARLGETFRAVLDLVVARRGTYYLAYHRWARPDQTRACYPQMPAWLAKSTDAGLVSNWARHYRDVFGVE